ncbi:hypothetical protein ASE06_04560 [Sphingopyxis sp. Root214]|uniref:hypothetical protein n=1 Tax=unclassified Sphingopyxis TaxID=2614943 RepID=UPI0006F7F31D|nr:MULTISPECIES: hypothetical protein [unclassified Sphingopyxis]KQZ76938.1 hypothetical protein ASD73_03435 [Sphingopyxis sp. Root154]KRC09178.1 hypothetical protein ASE06_04560 [Sphingopyxis sp. Root214]
MKVLLLSFLIGALAVYSYAAFSGYGNPWRDVTYSTPSGKRLQGKAFFLDKCVSNTRGEICELRKKYARTLMFVQGDGVQGYPGAIRGEGKPPIKLFAKLRRKVVGDPDLLLEAVKSCTDSFVHVEYRWHSEAIIVPETSDNLSTVRCVKSDLYGAFSAGLGNPLRGDADTTFFKSLETAK